VNCDGWAKAAGGSACWVYGAGWGEQAASWLWIAAAGVR